MSEPAAPAEAIDPPAKSGEGRPGTSARRSGARRLLGAGFGSGLSSGLGSGLSSGLGAGLGSVLGRDAATPDGAGEPGIEDEIDDELLDRITTDHAPGADADGARGPGGGTGWSGGPLGRPFFTLSRRILALNLGALVVLVLGVLYLNQFRESLVETQVESLTTQAGIIAGALAAQARVSQGTAGTGPERLLDIEDADPGAPIGPASEIDFPINPEIIAGVLGSVNKLIRTRVRVYDLDGREMFDTESFFQPDPALTRAERSVVSYGPGSMSGPGDEPSWPARKWRELVMLFNDQNLPIYRDYPDKDGNNYREVKRVIEGTPRSSMTRVTPDGQLIVSVAMPIQRFRQTLGVVMLTTEAGQIDRMVRNDRLGIGLVFLIATIVTVVLSILLARTIATPLHRLAQAADRVRRKVKDREEIPDFTHRRDEVGDLSGALRDMTSSLYSRIEAIESFAADVSHELKNPLTSLRSAVETLPLTRTDEQRGRLLEVINHDVQRLDRLISDISDASRLDAEMAREDYETVDLAHMLRMVHASAEQVMKAKQRAGERAPRLVLNIDDEIRRGETIDLRRILVRGHEGRLGQVVANLVSNARSFVPADGGWIAMDLRTRGEQGARAGEGGRPGREAPAHAVLTIADNGPGIPPDKKAKIFDRFYTDRPEGEAFGNNSGLGLSIVKQIVESHGGTIQADNWTLDDRFESDVDEADASRRGGAIFTVTLPLHRPTRD